MAIFGTEGNDNISASDLSSVDIFALGGDDDIEVDHISGLAYIEAGDGNDYIAADNVGAIEVNGGAGDDSFSVGSNVGALIFNGGRGDDYIFLGIDDFNSGEISGGAGYDMVDIWSVRPAQIRYQFDLANDIEAFRFQSSWDAEPARGPNIRFTANNSDNAISFLGAAPDKNRVVVDGLGGNDEIDVQDFDYILVRGGAGNDTIYIDLWGDGTAYGGDGNDRLSGGGTLYGDGGRDTFLIDGFDPAPTIADFDGGRDTIALTAFWPPLGEAGELDAALFRAGTQAQDADDRIIFNAVSGSLYFDADGNGTGSAQKLIATLNVARGQIDHTDFVVTGSAAADTDFMFG